MPELPEVETITKYLKDKIQGQQIIRVNITPKGERHFNLNPEQVRQYLTGKKIEGISRYGKWIIFDLGEMEAVSHLRMSGMYQVTTEKLMHPHNRFLLNLSSGKILNYLDQRRFGTFHIVKSGSEHLNSKGLGKDALEHNFTVDELRELFRRRKKSIYSTLLDQAVIAGLGNIYVNEILHASRLHPLTPANRVKDQDIELIITEMDRILNLALSMKGTSLLDNLYYNPEGGSGDFSQLLKVYGKKDNPDIEVLKIGGRSVFVHKDTKL